MRDNLFEIVLKDYEKMIFHTINENIKKHLIDNNVFEPIKKKSLIDSYVNKGYWLFLDFGNYLFSSHIFI